MRDGNRALGKHGENIAARFLSRKGYRIIGRNVRMFLGEIDIVALKRRETVFVEVKTRRPSSFGPPYLAVTWKKKRTLIRCAFCYLKMKGIERRAWRIDVISIELDDSGRHIKNIEHFENAV